MRNYFANLFNESIDYRTQVLFVLLSKSLGEMFQNILIATYVTRWFYLSEDFLFHIEIKGSEMN